MALANTKIVQAYIQTLVETVKTLRRINNNAISDKAKFVAKNPDLTGTNITSAQVTAVNNFLSDLNNLANSQVATTLLTKDQPSHGVEALE